MKELLQFLLGIVLMIAGGVMFLKNVVVSDWGLLSSLFRIGGGVNIGGIFIVLLVIAFIALLVKPNMNFCFISFKSFGTLTKCEDFAPIVYLPLMCVKRRFRNCSCTKNCKYQRTSIT